MAKKIVMHFFIGNLFKTNFRKYLLAEQPIYFFFSIS